MKVAILVTHLLGAGHLTRAARLARAFQAADHEVLLFSGGFPAAHIPMDGLRVCQLPPVRSDGVDFKNLRTNEDQPAGDAVYEKRVQTLTDELRRFRPDVLITELFPFGRRQLEAEFNAAIAAVKDALVVASIRDILAPPSTEKKARKTQETVAKKYDMVLVHSDPSITPLEQSWPVDDLLHAYLHYTGFIDSGAVVTSAEENHKVIVSAGGGAVGRRLFETSLEAARLMPEQEWLLLVGGYDALESCARFNEIAPVNAKATPTRPDFRSLLAGATASVSMCGYNTALDLLATRVPSVLIPFDEGSEIEQTIRAEALANLPGFAMLKDPDAATLVKSLQRVLADPRRLGSSAALDGAAKSVRLVENLQRQKNAV